MISEEVSTGMLYEFLKQFRSEFLEFKADVNRRFNESDRKIDDLRIEVRRDKEKLEKVYASRERVTVQWTRSWIGASFLIALGAIVASFALIKMF